MQIFSKILIIFIKAYQILFSPFFSPCCRYYPSCSEYAIEAVKRHGPGKGLYLGLRRLLRCHPFSRGGYDPVR